MFRSHAINSHWRRRPLLIPTGLILSLYGCRQLLAARFFPGLLTLVFIILIVYFLLHPKSLPASMPALALYVSAGLYLAVAGLIPDFARPPIAPQNISGLLLMPFLFLGFGYYTHLLGAKGRPWGWLLGSTALAFVAGAYVQTIPGWLWSWVLPCLIAGTGLVLFVLLRSRSKPSSLAIHRATPVRVPQMRFFPPARLHLYLFTITGISLLILLILKNAWMVDDAYITFRTIDNLFQGHGLRWNIIERVQGFTHPLWLMIVALGRLFTGEFYFTTFFISISCTALAAGIGLRLFCCAYWKWIILLSCLCLSKAFIDYSTSGLENPLLYFILAAFYYYYFRPSAASPPFFRLSLIAALGMLSRADSLLFFLPALGHAWWQIPREDKIPALRRMLLGSLPFIAWTLFSFIYYGALFPNTAYAKLNTGIPAATLALQGVFYFTHSLRTDPVTLLVVFLGTALALASQKRKIQTCGLGLVLYLLYILLIGGDSMSGRFLAAPYFAAVVLALLVLARLRNALLWFMGAFLFISLASPFQPAKTRPDYNLNSVPVAGYQGVDDTLGGYYQMTGLLRPFGKDHFGIKTGRELKAASTPVFVYGIVGHLGLAAGPGVHIIDVWALTDPLLSHLPCAENIWRPGHYTRKLPEGYSQSIHGANQIADPNLALFYDKIKMITRAPLFSAQRWRCLLGMLFGSYRRLINRRFYQTAVLSPDERDRLRVHEFLLRTPGRDHYARLMQAGLLSVYSLHLPHTLENWEKARSLNPARVEAHANLGLLYERFEKYAQAAEAYKTAARIAGPPWDSYYIQAKNAHFLSAGARPAFPARPERQRRRLADFPGNTPYARLIRRGIQALRQQDHIQAEKNWLEALQSNPDGWEALANLALLHESTGRWEQALEEYSRAAEHLGSPWTEYRDYLLQQLQKPEPRPPRP
ncbi:tetratricopeptide repeat protein [candidate division FCPU426 bacterium]|nr:tetratricopeptide repeat protein [candidate division FCPU426 bacterium]